MTFKVFRVIYITDKGGQNMFNISEKQLNRIKEKYPKGCRVELVEMNDPYSKLKPGDKGYVNFVDDIGTVHIIWDNGSSLGACIDDGDVIKRI